MISLDDLGFGDLLQAGPDFSSAVLEDIAQSSLRLRNYYVQHLCTPTRAAWMTGRYPFRSGLNRHVILNGIFSSPQATKWDCRSNSKPSPAS